MKKLELSSLIRLTILSAVSLVIFAICWVANTGRSFAATCARTDNVPITINLPQAPDWIRSCMQKNYNEGWETMGITYLIPETINVDPAGTTTATARTIFYHGNRVPVTVNNFTVNFSGTTLAETGATNPVTGLNTQSSGGMGLNTYRVVDQPVTVHGSRLPSYPGNFTIQFNYNGTVFYSNNRCAFDADGNPQNGCQTTNGNNVAFITTSRITITKYGASSSAINVCLYFILAQIQCTGNNTQARRFVGPYTDFFTAPYSVGTTTQAGASVNRIHENYYDENGNLLQRDVYNTGSLGNIRVAPGRETFIDVYYSTNPPPSGTVRCDGAASTVSGTVRDDSDNNVDLNVDLYWDRGADGNLTPPGYQRVRATGAGPNKVFSSPIPDAFKDGRVHSVWAYGIDYPAGNNNPELVGSPASCGVIQTPAPQFRPWLQTRGGDVTAGNSITGQNFSNPGSRNNYSYGEAAVYTAPGTSTGNPTFQTAGSVGVIDDNGSLNPVGQKKSMKLTDTNSAVVINYRGDISGIAAYVRGELYNGNPRFDIKITNTDTGQIVAGPQNYNVGGSYQFSNMSTAADLANSSTVLPTGNYKVELIYVNDSYGGSPILDRNLIVDQVKIYGKTISGPETSYVRTIGRVADLTGAGQSRFFCSLNYYFLTTIVTLRDSCDTSNGDGYSFGANRSIGEVTGSFISAIQRAYDASAADGVADNCDPYDIQDGGPFTSAQLTTDCPNGKIVKSNASVNLGDLNLVRGRATIWATGDIVISGNISGGVSGNRQPELQPSLGIIATGDVRVSSSITQVDASIFAGGKLKTCSAYPAAISQCQNPFRLSGQAITGTGYEFGRNFFNQYTSNQNPAERFTLSAKSIGFAPPGFDKLFWGLDDQLTFSDSEFPPRLR